ncbi:16114_t:CDS:1, partial [Entrophospora sp. SA101]
IGDELFLKFDASSSSEKATTIFELLRRFSTDVINILNILLDREDDEGDELVGEETADVSENGSEDGSESGSEDGGGEIEMREVEIEVVEDSGEDEEEVLEVEVVEDSGEDEEDELVEEEGVVEVEVI